MAVARTVRSRPNPAAVAYWIAVGALASFGMAALLTVGIFFLAVAALLTFLAVALKIDTRALPGLAIGAAVTPFYIAFLNRSGPGTICTRTATSTSCSEQWNPWFFVAVGVVFVAVGIILLLRRRRPKRTIPDPPYPVVGRQGPVP